MDSRALALEQVQLEKLNYVLNELWERNPFYTYKWCQAGVTTHRLGSIQELRLFPLTTRSELLQDQQNTPPLGANLTCPYYMIKRLHRSSGTTHAPLYWADNPKSWSWVMRCSLALFLMAGVLPDDRILFPTTFTQLSGPWIMYEGACKLGCCCFSAPDIEEQIHCLDVFRPTVLIAKPSQLHRLAIALHKAGIATASAGVEKLIFTGEPVSSEARNELQSLWNAETFDRYGLTEAGPVAGECQWHSGGMHVLESEVIAEVIDPKTEDPVPDGNTGELVLTTLGRITRPIVRYRTGDFVRLVREHQCPCGRADALLAGGVSRPLPASDKT